MFNLQKGKILINCSKSKTQYSKYEITFKIAPFNSEPFPLTIAEVAAEWLSNLDEDEKIF